MLEKIVSGGQTGVDRAALAVALRLGLECGGWCPGGRLAEDGAISAVFPLQETPSSEYIERTLWNVRDADGTLILAHGPLAGGTAYTAACARKLGKPWHIEDLAANANVSRVSAWLRAHDIRTLNVAGPRASTVPGIYELASAFMEAFLAETGTLILPPSP